MISFRLKVSSISKHFVMCKYEIWDFVVTSEVTYATKLQVRLCFLQETQAWYFLGIAPRKEMLSWEKHTFKHLIMGCCLSEPSGPSSDMAFLESLKKHRRRSRSSSESQVTRRSSSDSGGFRGRGWRGRDPSDDDDGGFKSWSRDDEDIEELREKSRSRSRSQSQEWNRRRSESRNSDMSV